MASPKSSEIRHPWLHSLDRLLLWSCRFWRLGSGHLSAPFHPRVGRPPDPCPDKRFEINIDGVVAFANRLHGVAFANNCGFTFQGGTAAPDFGIVKEFLGEAGRVRPRRPACEGLLRTQGAAIGSTHSGKSFSTLLRSRLTSYAFMYSAA
jgi:hypothetical protein